MRITVTDVVTTVIYLEVSSLPSGTNKTLEYTVSHGGGSGSFGLISSASAHQFSISGLEAGTNYSINCTLYYTDSQGKEQSQTASISQSTRPSYFWWSNAVIKNGEFNITARDWNNLVDHVNALRTFKGLISLNMASLYASSNDIFTATKYNTLATVINDLFRVTGNLKTDYEQGDIITAACIEDLETMVNTVTYDN